MHANTSVLHLDQGFLCGLHLCLGEGRVGQKWLLAKCRRRRVEKWTTHLDCEFELCSFIVFDMIINNK